jgi:hypothetical protein
MVMVTPGRDEGRLRAVGLHEFETQHPAVEVQGALELRDLEVHVPDADRGLNRWTCLHPAKLGQWPGKAK